jgi:hypothetical protein
VPGAGVTQGRKIHTFEESLTGAEQDWRYGYVHLVDKALAKILLDDIDSATNANILASSGSPGALKSDDRAFCDEVESRSAFHDERRARMVRQNKDGDVVHGVVAPPPPPTLIWPGSANRPEHVPAKNPSPDVLKTSSGKVFINAGCSAITTEQVLLKRSCGHGPAMKRGAAHAEWIVDVLVWAGTETVE